MLFRFFLLPALQGAPAGVDVNKAVLGILSQQLLHRGGILGRLSLEPEGMRQKVGRHGVATVDRESFATPLLSFRPAIIPLGDIDGDGKDEFVSAVQDNLNETSPTQYSISPDRNANHHTTNDALLRTNKAFKMFWPLLPTNSMGLIKCNMNHGKMPSTEK